MTRRDVFGVLVALPVVAAVAPDHERVRYVGGFGSGVHIVPRGCSRYYPGSGGIAAELAFAAVTSIAAVDLGWKDADGLRVFGLGFGGLG